MTDLEYWRRALKEAEAALHAARTRTAVKKLQLAKSELKRLDKAATRGASGVAVQAVSS